MKLRKLELKDAPLMLEWMHDKTVVENLRTDFQKKTLSDCEKFIISSWDDKRNVNYAITDDNDTYLGTVGLKNVTAESAEFAITIRKCAMGKGYSKEAMTEVIRLGFEKMYLKCIYWCVSPKNTRAVRFYDKNFFHRVSNEMIKEFALSYTPEQIATYVWYAEFYKERGGTNI